MRTLDTCFSLSAALLPVSVSGIIHLSHHLPQDIYELKDQIQDVEGKYMQGLKEMKVLVYWSLGVSSLTPTKHFRESV